MKYIRKLTPVGPLDIAAAQRWLERLAAQGLYLVRWGGLWCTFRRDQPAQVRYRLDPVQKQNRGPEGEPSPDVLETYAHAGWHYICPRGNSFYVFLTRDPEAPELYTDAMSYSLAIKYVIRGAWLSAVCFLAYAASLLYFSFSRYRFQQELAAEPSYVRRFVESQGPFTLILVLSILPLLLFQVYSHFRLIRACLALRSGSPPPRRSGGQLVFYSAYHALQLFLLVLLAVNCCLAVVYQRQSGFHPVEEAPVSVPALAELEAHPEFVLEPYDQARGYAYHEAQGSYFRAEPTLWSPVHLTIRQEGDILSLWWKDLVPDYSLNMRYSPSLAIELWEIRGGALARAFYAEREDLLSTRAFYGPSRVLDLPGIDRAVLFETENGSGQRLLLRRGSRVAEITYFSAKDLTAYLSSWTTLMDVSWGKKQMI